MKNKELRRFKTSAMAVTLVLGGMLIAGGAQAGATIYSPSGSIALGVNDEGHLNTSDGHIAANSGRTGLAYQFPDGTYQDATAPGCYCEGWGVSASGTAGWDNESSGGSNLTVDSFTSTANTATSTVHLTSLPGLTVTQAYSPADNAPNALFKDVVTITNTTGGDLTDLRYVRVMDWDIPRTEFDEFVTIQGTATTTFLEHSHDDGFETSNPLATTTPILAGTEDVDFVDSGPADHGAYFLFNFGDLLGTDDPLTAEDETSYTFTIFYGAAANEADALAAIAAESIELFSLGQSNADGKGARPGTPGDDNPTFIFGFAGVGGTPVIPTVPEPTSLALVGMGLMGAAAARRRRKSKQA